MVVSCFQPRCVHCVVKNFLAIHVPFLKKGLPYSVRDNPNILEYTRQICGRVLRSWDCSCDFGVRVTDNHDVLNSFHCF